ncbi:unnamed protein product [Gadus morhua 'NCC']
MPRRRSKIGGRFEKRAKPSIMIVVPRSPLPSSEDPTEGSKGAPPQGLNPLISSPPSLPSILPDLFRPPFILLLETEREEERDGVALNPEATEPEEGSGFGYDGDCISSVIYPSDLQWSFKTENLNICVWKCV